MKHPIQCRAFDKHFVELILDFVTLKPLAKCCLVAKDRRFSERSPMVADFLFPSLLTNLTNAPQVLIARLALGFTISVLPDARPFARRNGRSCLTLIERLITIPPVISPIGAHLRNWAINAIQQLRKHLRISNVVGTSAGGDNLSRCFIDTEMQLAPGSPLAPSVLPDFPFAFAVNFHAGRIDHQMA